MNKKLNMAEREGIEPTRDHNSPTTVFQACITLHVELDEN